MSTPSSGAITREKIVKPVDAWWTVLLVDPIATRVIPPLARVRWVSPTAITLVAHALGIVAAALFAVEAMVPAALVFEVRFVLDCIDGKLARATGRTSTVGMLLDAFGDRVLFVVIVAAFGWRLAPAALVVLAAAYPLQFHLMETRERLLATAGAAKPMERLVRAGWGGAMASRRMFPMPTSVDVEHVLLFGGPLLWAAGVDVLEPLLWAATAYFVLQCVRYGAGTLRAAALADQARA